MLETVRKPNTFYAAGLNNAMINPKDLTKEVYDYYWTSYSRGTDGNWSPNDPNWNNEYLDVYNQQRPKSVFDPCPYGFRIPANGVFNRMISYSIWKNYNYNGGVKWSILGKSSWLINIGVRDWKLGYLYYLGDKQGYWSALNGSIDRSFHLFIFNTGLVSKNNNWERSYGFSIRCIEDAKKEVDDITTTSFSNFILFLNHVRRITHDHAFVNT